MVSTLQAEAAATLHLTAGGESVRAALQQKENQLKSQM